MSALPAPTTALSARSLRAIAIAVAGSLTTIWLLLTPQTADLAAQVYRSRLFAERGFLLWDNAWFGGHLLPGYSLVFPPLAGLFGPRTVGVVAVICSGALFAQLLRRYDSAHPRAAAIWFAAAAAGDLFIGRLTFALGVTLGLAAIVALGRGRGLLALPLAAACAAASPVAGLFLAFVAIAGGSSFGRRSVLMLAGPALATAGLMEIAFPEGGSQPYDLQHAAFAVAVVLLAAVLSERTLVRRGALLYAVAIAAAFIAPSPMGSNVARLGALLGGPLLVSSRRDLRRAPVIAVALALAGWQLWAPVTEVAKTMDNPATKAPYYAPLVSFLASAGADAGRVEVVPTTTRWESVFVAQRFALARGWESQLDHRYNPLFYSGTLTAAGYGSWLRDTGVRFVALPDAALDRYGKQEGALLSGTTPAYLHLVWSNDHWRVFAVAHPRPLVSAGARMVTLGPKGFALDFTRGGSVTVRVHYTRFWHADGTACARPSPDGWTTVDAPAAGVVHASASWSFDAALGANPACTGAGGG